jgi:hypothetical protein
MSTNLHKLGFRKITAIVTVSTSICYLCHIICYLCPHYLLFVSTLFVICVHIICYLCPHYFLFVLFCVLCVNVYCYRVTTQLQLINISYHKFASRHYCRQTSRTLLSSTTSDWGYLLRFPSKIPSRSVARYGFTDWYSICFVHYGDLPHFLIAVREFLNSKLQRQWIRTRRNNIAASLFTWLQSPTFSSLETPQAYSLRYRRQ